MGWPVAGPLRIFVLALLWLLAGAGANAPCAEEVEGGIGTMQIQSSAFNEGDTIPTKHTCEGEDVSPQLSWSAPPEGTKSLALVCDDPDAPVGTWVHWVLYNLPGDTTSLPENIPPDETLDNGGVHGTTDFGRIGYGGPAPPSGTHRYYFKIYALDSMLDLAPGATKAQLEKAMKGHILAEGQLMGKYKRR